MHPVNLLPCTPPAWAKGGHLQTIWGHVLPSPRLRELGTPHVLSLPDGDRLHLTLYEGTIPATTVLLHGLGGDAHADYMERTAGVCLDLGHAVILVNFRGCGQGWGLSRGFYHAGRGEDISEVIAFSRTQWPGHRQIAVGFSLGANALLCLLTGLRGTSLPDAAISLNAPIDLALGAKVLQQGGNRVYDQYFFRRLRRSLYRRVRENLLEPQPLALRTVKSLQQFDDVFTAVQGGFGGVENYYAQCSTHLHLSKITVPTILLTAADDPIVPVAPYLAAKLSPAVQMHIEPTGGHLGYITKRPTPLGTRRWQDYAIREAIKSLLAD